MSSIAKLALLILAIPTATIAQPQFQYPLVPGSSNTLDIGTTSRWWRGLYVGNINLPPPPTYQVSNSSLHVYIDASDYAFPNGSNVTNFLARNGGLFTNTDSTVTFGSSVFANGHPAFVFSGNVTDRLVSSNVLFQAGLNAVTAFAVVSLTNNDVYFHILATPVADDSWYMAANGTFPELLQFSTSDMNRQFLSATYPFWTTTSNFNWVIFATRFDGTNKWIGDGRNWEKEVVTGTFSVTTTNLLLGARNHTGNSPFSGVLGKFLLYTNALDEDVCRSISLQLANEFGISTNYPPLLVADGDSMTRGQALAGAEAWPYRFGVISGRNWATRNSGSGGDTVANIYSSVLSGDSSGLPPPGVQASYVLFAGRNDIDLNSSTDYQVEQWISGTCSNVVKRGMKVYVVTVPPSTNTTGLYESTRASVNSWLRVNWGNFANGLIDMSFFPEWDTTTNAPCWQADHIHPTAIGLDLLANLAWRTVGIGAQGGGWASGSGVLTVSPSNLHNVALGKGWTNDLASPADLVISVKYVDSLTGDPAFSFTNSVTGEAWTNTIALGAVATVQQTVVIPDIAANNTGSFTDLSGAGASIVFLNAWWKLK